MRRYLLAVVACAVVFVASLTEEGDAAPTRFDRNPKYEEPVSMRFESLTYTIDGRGCARDLRTDEPLPYWATRAKVPGGWFVTLHDESGFFYPDPDHSWDGKSID